MSFLAVQSPCSFSCCHTGVGSSLPCRFPSSLSLQAVPRACSWGARGPGRLGRAGHEGQHTSGPQLPRVVLEGQAHLVCAQKPWPKPGWVGELTRASSRPLSLAQLHHLPLLRVPGQEAHDLRAVRAAAAEVWGAGVGGLLTQWVPLTAFPSGLAPCSFALTTIAVAVMAVQTCWLGGEQALGPSGRLPCPNSSP